MREVTRYEADDGTPFDNRADCEAYEAGQADRKRVKAWIDSLPTDGEDAISGRAATRMSNDVMAFLAWERGQGGQGGKVADAVRPEAAE